MTLPDVWWSCDPGVAYAAWAVWAEIELVGTGLDPIGEFVPQAGLVQLLVIEKPQVYKNARARSSDLVDLAVSTGRIAAPYENVVYYLPREWKGQTPKGIHHARIVSALSEYERRALPKRKGELKHVLDAVGIGLYHMKQMGAR